MSRLAHQKFAWGGTAQADLAAQAVRDQQMAAQAIRDIRAGTSNTDHLLRILLNLLADYGHVVPPRPGLRAFMREIQKHVETEKS